MEISETPFAELNIEIIIKMDEIFGNNELNYGGIYFGITNSIDWL